MTTTKNSSTSPALQTPLFFPNSTSAKQTSFSNVYQLNIEQLLCRHQVAYSSIPRYKILAFLLLFKKDTIYFPSTDRCQKIFRNIKIQKHFENGEKVSDIARHYRMSSRQIRNIIKKNSPF